MTERNAPEISVVVPVHDVERHLPRCLESLLAQTFPDFELVAVDDGSTDGCARILEEAAARDARVVVLRQENKGLSEARNAGLDAARGRWIAFVDGDDMVAPDFLETLLRAARATGAGVACCGKLSFSDDRGVPGPEKTPARGTELLAPARALANALWQNDRPDYSAWNKLYAAELWKDRRFPPGKFFEDMATVPQVLLEAKAVAFVDAPLCLYRRRPGSILASAFDLRKAELLDVAESVRGLVRGKGAELERAAACNLFSAACSVLMRAPETEEFAGFRDRAWKDLRASRGAALSPRSRFRNKAAALLSLGGRAFFEAALRRFA